MPWSTVTEGAGDFSPEGACIQSREAGDQHACGRAGERVSFMVHPA